MEGLLVGILISSLESASSYSTSVDPTTLPVASWLKSPTMMLRSPIDPKCRPLQKLVSLVVVVREVHVSDCNRIFIGTVDHGENYALCMLPIGMATNSHRPARAEDVCAHWSL